jgi:hypothetical protein
LDVFRPSFLPLQRLWQDKHRFYRKPLNKPNI